MTGVPGKGNGLGGLTTHSELPVSDLFGLLWDALADLLGTAATATLLKRAARRASRRSPELGTLVIRRVGLGFGYSCPSGWTAAHPGTPPALHALIDELRPLLIEMTGQLVIQHLDQILELRERGLLTPQEQAP